MQLMFYVLELETTCIDIFPFNLISANLIDKEKLSNERFILGHSAERALTSDSSENSFIMVVYEKRFSRT